MQPQEQPEEQADYYRGPYEEPYQYDYRDPNSVHPDVTRQLTALSDPRYQAADQYVLVPPPPRGQSLPGKVADATIASIAHFAIAFGLFGLGFLISIGISVGIWIYGKRSPFVEFQARQAGAYQCFVLLFNIFYVVFLGVLIAFGSYYQWGWALALAFALGIAGVVWFFLSIFYGVYGGLRVLAGRDFRYPFFGRDRK